jgi:hypothetical protein
MDLRHELYEAKKELKFQRASEKITRAEKVMEEMHFWVKRMQFLSVEDELIACNFIRDVLEPVVQWSWQGKSIHLAKAPSLRDAPSILIRPRLAIWALIQIYSHLRPSIRCSGERGEGRFTFVIRFERKVNPQELESVDRACELLQAAGAETQLSPATAELAITLDLARTQS